MGSIKSSPRKLSLILWDDQYEQVDVNTVIKMLLRSKKLYEAMGDAKTILRMVSKK